MERQQDTDSYWGHIDVENYGQSKKLKILLQTDKKQYRPGQRTAVTLKVIDNNGNPCEAEVSLAVVDQSLYSFGEERITALLSPFSNNRSYNTYWPKSWRIPRQMGERVIKRQRLREAQKKLAMQSSSRHLATPVSFATAPQLPGMPVANFPLLRRDFRETAAWYPQLHTKDGKITTYIDFPHTVGEYRMTAVALTKDTKIGHNHSSIKVTLPLIMQIFVPRFAIKEDQFSALAIIHNNSNKQISGNIVWNITGAKVIIAKNSTQKIKHQGQTKSVFDKINIAANSSSEIRLNIKMNHVGSVKVACSITSKERFDSEQRSFPVYPLARPHKVLDSGYFQKSKQIILPKGFIANELQVNLSPYPITQALDGLSYLIQYPYGCVEQTMSRFLPSVVVKNALNSTTLALPKEIEAKLPQVIDKGLKRLYNFQHADGGWGWWKNDSTDDKMTVYVIYGLLRCQQAGIKIDSLVLRRACLYLQTRLLSNQFNSSLKPYAWYVLTVAGNADLEALTQYAQKTLDDNSKNVYYLALAIYTAQLKNLFTPAIKAIKRSNAQTTTEIALKLQTQIKFNFAQGDIATSVTRLLARRKGQRWENTWATSIAITVLAEVLAKGIIMEDAPQLDLFVENQLTAASAPPSKFQLIKLPQKDQLKLSFTSNNNKVISYSLAARGHKYLNQSIGQGTDIKMFRKYDKKVVHCGQFIKVDLILELAQDFSYLLMEDYRPAGLEFAVDNLSGDHAYRAANTEFRDDRICIFFPRLNKGKYIVSYYLRAETVGEFYALPGHVYPMYKEEIRGETRGNKVSVR